MTRLQHIDLEVLLVAAKRDPGGKVEAGFEDRDRETRWHDDVLAGIWIEKRRVIRAQWVGHRSCRCKTRHREDGRERQHRQSTGEETIFHSRPFSPPRN